MTTITPELPVTITATNRASMDRQLNDAVTFAQARAMHERRGILVTRHGHDSFTIAVSDAVPFGLTREHQAW
jgi:hypothetical protein